MTDNSMLPPPGGPASPRTAVTRPAPQTGPALLSAVLIVLGSAAVGLAAGLIWAAVAPRVQYQVATLHPPTAYATNPETSAFIAADGWYCAIALVGGALIGLLAYLLAVRRYGALPMTGVVIGSVAAAFIAEWLGHQASGGPGFNGVLATSKPGAYLYAPISLGSHGALAFWPLAAAAVAGGIGLASMLRGRHHAPYGGVPMPGMDSFGMRPYAAERPESGRAQPQAAGSPAAPAQPGADGSGLHGGPGPDARGGNQGHASR
jgi:hypothetical protein